MDAIGGVRRRLTSDEEGFTIVEILVAAFIVVIGSLAVFMSLATSIRGVQRSKEVQQGVSVAQREMERVRAEPFAGIGLTGNLTRVSEAASPLSRVSAGGTEFNVNRSGTARSLPLVTTGTLANKVEGVRSPDGTEATVYRFVVCEETGVSQCSAKRIVIDVQTVPQKNQVSYKHGYYELQSTVTKTGG
ncbi:MAG: type II secretion system protein [Actinobacteria bacterium]|nr:type II secretion system protein [Actinomycetota bacterium]